MSGAICWMLQGWTPARWALLGGLLSLVRLATCSYWMNSYWGGAVAAVGGCLVMGAYPRIARQGRVGYAGAMGVGLVILDNTRPLEGAISSLPIAVAMLRWPWQKPRARLAGAGMPLAFCLAVGAALTRYYNYRVTGHALRRPYMEYAGQYQPVTPLLLRNIDDRQIAYANSDM